MNFFGSTVTKLLIGKIFAGMLAICFAGYGILYAQRVVATNALLEKLLPYTEEKTSFLDNKNFLEYGGVTGIKLKVGKAYAKDFEISQLQDSAVIAENIEVFDSRDELIAKVDKAEVSFKVLNFIGKGAGALDEINIDGAQIFIKKRADDTWNLQDIKVESEGESTFGATINLKGGTVTADFDGKNISVEEITASADCANMDAIGTKLSAVVLGSHIDATGTLGANKQYAAVNIDSADILKILPYIPEDLIPENIEIHGGKTSNTSVNVYRRGEVLEYLGYTTFSEGAVLVEKTEITDIAGTATFSNEKFDINAGAVANGQAAKVSGVIRVDTDEPYFDINAESESFAPAAVIENIGIDGAAGFTAHVFGTAENPKVEAKIFSDYLGYENLSARNIETNLRYANNAVYLSNIKAETFGGIVAGEAEITAENLAYNAHVKAAGINLAQVGNYAGANVDIFGNVNADLALNGTGADLNTLKIYGSADGKNIACQNFNLENLETSFYLNGDDLKFDYLNMKLPNRGTVNLEGTVVDAQKLDFEFYGAHIDLNLAKKFDPSIDVSGISDFSGSIHGDISNPEVALTLSAVDTSRFGGAKGEIFNQPYDSMQVEMSGSFDAVNVGLFELEKDGKIHWQVMDGLINLKERKLNVRLDTVAARLESIVAMLAPDQELTGEFDNTIRVQGTFENPELVGYVEMKYGRYGGILISGMRGDYYIEDGDKFRLQDFQITTPMVDIVLNGTLNINTYALDMVVHGREIDLRRFQRQFPYEVSGNGKFEGVIAGTINAPRFDGQLTSDSLTFNGVELKNITGHIGATSNSVILDDVKFEDGSGKYEMYLSADVASGAINGAANVEKASLETMAALANYKNDLISGELTSNIEVGGTVNNPNVRVLGAIEKGAIGKYDLHNVDVNVHLSNNVANINTFRGLQGENGKFEIVGSANLTGPINVIGAIENVELGIIGAAAGVDADFTGTTNFNFKVGGDISNPTGDLVLSASGGIKGSTFDLLRGHIVFKDWVFNVDDLTVERALGETVYRAGAKGVIPYEALYIENTNPSQQINLTVSLDDADLSLLPVLSDAIGWATGAMAGNVLITGTASDPQIKGAISIGGGTVKVKGMNNLIENFNVSTEFTGDKFIVDNFSGNIGKGLFTLNGGLSFAGFNISNYTFDFVADNLDIQSTFFTGPLNAQFSLNEETLRDKTLPKVSGHLDLEKCLFSVPTLPDSDDPLPEMLLDVSINLGEKVHFYSSRLYNMHLTGGVRYEGSTLFPKPSGIISVKRGGTINYISTVFDITEGEMHFNQLGEFFPSLNFAANARVSNIRVDLSVTGPLNNAQLKLTSNPEKTETEIIQLLTLRDAYGNQTSNMSMADILAIGLQMSILGDIEDTIKRTLGFDRFVFSSGSGSALDEFANKEDSNNKEEEFNISIGKYVTDKLMLKYTQGINGDKITRLGVQYDLNDNLGLNVENEKGEYIFSFEAKYKF